MPKLVNPIISGFYPDPSICRVGKWYYLVTSSFEYFPGVPLFRSQDLIHWEQIGHCITRPSQADLVKTPNSDGIYAPTIRYHNGRFYMITTNVKAGGNFYLYTDDILGEWSEPVFVDIKGIDPSLYFEGEKVYISTNRGKNGDENGLSCTEINIETGELLSEIEMIWGGTGGKFVEAPHIYKKDGYYYLMVSEGGTQYGHMVTIARSRSILGPYESNPSNPILSHREVARHPIQATGHGDLFMDYHGQWWIVFLGIRTTNSFHHHLGRETFLAPVNWEEGKWPVVNGNRPIELEMEVDHILDNNQGESGDFFDNFSLSKLDNCWNFIRTPYLENYRYGMGYLELTGTEISINEQDSPSLICKRQSHFSMEVTTELLCSPKDRGDEAGVTVFFSQEFHYEICLKFDDGQRYIVVKRRVLDIFHEEYRYPLNRDSIVLSIRSDKNNYYFGWGESQDEIQYISRASTQLLSAEMSAKSFTGNYIGLYNHSKTGTECRFNWFKYKKI